MQSLEFPFIYCTSKTLEKYLLKALNGPIKILKNGLKRDDEEETKLTQTLLSSLRRIKSSLFQQQPVYWFLLVI